MSGLLVAAAGLVVLSSCSATEPPGTVTLGEDEFRTTMSEAGEEFGAAARLIVESTDGELVAESQARPVPVSCGEPYGDSLRKAHAVAAVIIQDRPAESTLNDRLRPAMEDLGWTQETNDAGTTRFSRTTETKVTLTLSVGVGQDPEGEGTSQVRALLDGSCMRLRN